MSGIYIPGFFVPRKTGIVSIMLSGDGSALLCEDGAYKEIKVIPVPDHGRLIDADALMESDLGGEPYKSVIRRVLMQAPTIIPAEEGE